jgi:hypothetical protein
MAVENDADAALIDDLIHEHQLRPFERVTRLCALFHIGDHHARELIKTRVLVPYQPRQALLWRTREFLAWFLASRRSEPSEPKAQTFMSPRPPPKRGRKSTSQVLRVPPTNAVK